MCLVRIKSKLVAFCCGLFMFVIKIGILFPAFICYAMPVISQAIDQTVSFPSPNAASLGTFGKVPVSLFTGTPDVTIPLYTVKEGNFNIPIMLRYHGSGIRVEEQPSWVGLGWALQAGGAITRTVKGINDDINGMVGISSNRFKGRGYFYTHDLLNQTDWFEYSNDIYYDENTSPYFEREPDEFNFSFNGISGSFYLNHKGDWIVKSDIPIKVEFDKTAFNSDYFKRLNFYPRTEYIFYKFKLITPDGTTYVFGGNMSSIEFTRYPTSNKAPIATTWNLTKIIDPNGDEVVFNYIRGNLFPQITYNQHSESTMGQFWGMNALAINSSLYYSCILIEPSYLESIKTKSQTVMFYSSTANDLQIPSTILDYTEINLTQFCNGYDIVSYPVNTQNPIDYNIHPYSYNDDTYDANGIKFGIVEPEYRKRKQLDNIVIFPNNNHIAVPTNESLRPLEFPDAFKIIQFKYNQDATIRLMLEGITTSSNDYLVNKNYAFDYYHNQGYELPDYGTFKIDHWGYYNGRSSILSNSETFGEYYSKRDPNDDMAYQLEGMLRMIKYPTGGYTEIDYEPHKYAFYFNRVISDDLLPYIKYIDIEETDTELLGGGLRVKEIRSYTRDNVMSGKHTYKYVKGYGGVSTSSGYLMNNPQYIWPVRIVESVNNTLDGFYSYFSNSSLLPLSVTGTHIGYSEVVEIEEGNGYTIHKYTMPSKAESTPYEWDDIPYQDLAPVNMTGNALHKPVVDRSLERGKLLSKEIYNNSSIPVKKTTYKYNSDPNRFQSHVRSKNHEHIDYGYDLPLTSGTAILIFTYPFYVEEEKEVSYINGVETTTITNTYTHNALGQVTSVTQNQSDGSVITTEFKYPKDYRFPYSEIPMIKQLINKNIIDAEIERIISTTKSGSKYIIGARFTKYGSFNTNIKPHTIYSLNLDTPILSNNYIGWSPSSTEGSFTLATSNYTIYYPKTTSIDLNSGYVIGFAPSFLSKSDPIGSNNWMTLQIDRDMTNLELIRCDGESLLIPELTFSEAGTYKFTINYSDQQQDHYGTWSPSYTIYNPNDIIVNSLLNPEVTFDYDDKGNISNILKTNEAPLSFIWGYNSTFPVIRGENIDELTLSGLVTSALPNGFSTLESLLKSITSLPDANWTSFNTNLGNYINVNAINCTVSTYTYSPINGVTSQTDSNGITTYYEYDDFGRLKGIIDHEGNILQEIKYNYYIGPSVLQETSTD